MGRHGSGVEPHVDFLMICVYAGSLFVTERLFIILKPGFDTRYERIYWITY